MDLALVTVLFNCPEVLPGFFQSLATQTFSSWHLYVIDNSTDDRSWQAAQAEVARHGFADVTLIRNDQNVGVAAANNQGIRLGIDAGAARVLLLNNDIEFDDPTLLRRLFDYASSGGHAMVVPKMFYFDTPLIWCAGGDIDAWTAVTTHRGERQADGPAFAATMPTGYAPTCFMLIDRSVFDRIGIMDEAYFVYYDDTDFVWRSRVAGIQLVYWSEGSIRHKVSSSTGGGTSAFTQYYADRNRLYFIMKNFRGLHGMIALAYFFATRPLKPETWSTTRLAILRRSVRDAFAMRRDAHLATARTQSIAG